MNMKFFINIFLDCIKRSNKGKKQSKPDLIISIFSKFVKSDPDGDNPLRGKDEKYICKIATDEKQGITGEIAEWLSDNYCPIEMINCLDKISNVQVLNIISEFEKHNAFINEDNYACSIVNMFEELLIQTKNNPYNKNLVYSSKVYFNDNGEKISKSIDNDIFYDENEGCIVKTSGNIYIPRSEDYTSMLVDDNLPHNIALREIYDELVDEVKFNEKQKFKHYQKNNEYFNMAEWLIHSSRDVLIENHEKEVETLMGCVYDAIIEEYDDFHHEDGYSRLKECLKASTNANIKSSSFSTIRNYVNTDVKKGFCHELVDKGKIKSWVNIDDE